ncbi:hypothetical protein HAZT_HAZT003651 [Hyalella azteca]|uniref:Suppressor of cytokine signaling 5 n=1 Tax=Hyalella azteca TaxID=294128 RepID=A0A6A0GRM6_HYAAZ|nr:hypothetical protein HAZT_HAZT003651 [Hyalella azteca]
MAKAYIPENVIDLSAFQTVDLLNANKGVSTEKDSLRLIDDCKCLEMQSRHSTPDHDAVSEDPSIKYLFKHQTSSASQKIHGATNHVCCDASSPKVRPNIDHNSNCDADERALDVASTQHCYHYHNMTRPAENILSSSLNFNTRSNLQCSDRYCQSHTGWPLSRVDGSRFNFNDDCKASASTLNNLSAYLPRTSNVGVKSSRGFGENFGGIDSDTASVCSHVCRSCGTQLMNTLSDLNSKPRNDLSIPEVPSEESNDDCSIMKGVQKETILSTLSLSTSSGNHSLKSAIQKFVCKKMKYPTKELSGISLRKSKHSASFLRMCATLANRAGITRPALPASLSSDGITTPCSTSANFDLGPLNLTPINSNFSSNGERSSCSVDQRQKSTLTHRYQKATSESSFQIFLGQNALLKDSAECIASKSTDSGAVTRESCSTRGTMPRPWTCSNVAERKAIEKSLQSESSLLSHLHDSRLRKHQEIEELEAVQTVHTQIDYIHCLVPDLLTITGCSFYWGKMDRYEAETLLENRPEGTFLLRDSAQTDYLFSVSFRRYGKSLHARIEQGSHKFSFDSHDPDVFASDTVCGLIQHYKDPSCCMFFEPMLTVPLSRTFPFPLQHLCRATICSATTYDGINKLRLPKFLRNYLREYHYKQLVRIRRFDH